MTFRFQYLFALLTALLSSGGIVFAQKAKAVFVCKDKGTSYSNQWTLVADVKSLKLKPQSGSMKLPKKYHVFVVATAHLNTRLTELRMKGGTIELPLPDTSVSFGFNCETFKVENSGTMSPALNAKYPQIVSLKGFSLKNKNNTIRYDYNGIAQNISIIWNGINYLYVPYKSNNKTYYLLYNKMDDNNSKQLKNY